jgi:DHA2 family multidrug resistance protein
MVSRGTVLYRSRLSEHIVPGDPRVEHWLSVGRAAFASLGGGDQLSASRTFALLDGYVTRQAAVLAYNHVYQLITLSFVGCLPLVLLLRRPSGHVEVELAAD